MQFHSFETVNYEYKGFYIATKRYYQEYVFQKSA